MLSLTELRRRDGINVQTERLRRGKHLALFLHQLFALSSVSVASCPDGAVQIEDSNESLGALKDDLNQLDLVRWTTSVQQKMDNLLDGKLKSQVNINSTLRLLHNDFKVAFKVYKRMSQDKLSAEEKHFNKLINIYVRLLQNYDKLKSETSLTETKYKPNVQAFLEEAQEWAKSI